MKKYSAIKDMYYGNRGVHDKFKIENEEKLVLSAITENEELLLKKLSQKPEMLEIYKKLDNAIGELTLIENEHCYIEGFRFGFLMAMDFFEV
ncbi:MAG: hypothetical protein IKW33_00770 [Clostridia bacterium]|nr:hypothetical protein [Clostridia bacterium]